MIIIDTVSSTRFSVDGVPYLKNYISEVAGNQITIFNAYDRKDIRVDWTHYGDITLNGVVYGNSADLQSNLLPVIYTRASLGGASGVQSIVAGTNITVDDTDPENPIVSSTGGGGGAVTSVNSDIGAVIVDLQSATDEGNETTNDVIFRLDADKFIKVDSTNQVIQIFDLTIDAVNPIAYWNGTQISFADASNNVLDMSPTYFASNFADGSLWQFSGAILNIGDGSGSMDLTPNALQFNAGASATLYSIDKITIDGVDYDLPTGASSQIATLLDIPAPITIDATPTDGSSNAVSSNGVFDALALKSNKNEVETFIFSKSGGSYGSHTGTTAETVLLSLDITGGEFVASDILTYIAFIEKPLINGSATIRVRAGVNGTTSDALIATSNPASNTDVSNYIERTRHQFLSGNILKVSRNNTAVFSDRTATSRLDSISLTFSSAWKLTFTIQLSNALDEATLTGYRIGKIKTI
jgi:hypothetical protein